MTISRLGRRRRVRYRLLATAVNQRGQQQRSDKSCGNSCRIGQRSTNHPKAGSPLSAAGQGNQRATIAQSMRDPALLVGRIGGIVASLDIDENRSSKRLSEPAVTYCARCSGCLPRAAAENHGIDIADHPALHDLALFDRDVSDTGNVLHVYILERAVQSLGGRDRLAIAVADIVVDVSPDAAGQAGLNTESRPIASLTGAPA